MNFLALGCAGKGMAESMRDHMNLSETVVAYITRDSDMPSWGQLGCNGFILLDAENQVVSKATPAYNAMREMAFRHTEKLMDAVLNKAAPPTILPGQYVQIHGLNKRSDLNGKFGLCTGTVDNGRLQVALLDSEQSIAVKETNLSIVDEPELKHNHSVKKQKSSG